MLARLASRIITAEEEKVIEEEDLQFHLRLLVELRGFESESEEEREETLGMLDIEVVEQETARCSGKLNNTEKQEVRDKARAWALDHKREKEKKGKIT